MIWKNGFEWILSHEGGWESVVAIDIDGIVKSTCGTWDGSAEQIAGYKIDGFRWHGSLVGCRIGHPEVFTYDHDRETMIDEDGIEWMLW